MSGLGAIELLITTILGSSILPIPSETILLGIGLQGINPIEAAIYGGIGSTIGSIIAYGIGKAYGKKLIEKIGKYFFITKKTTAALNKWFEKFGSATVFVSRLIPIVPHKTFSIIAGTFSADFKNFVLFTLIGSIPRCFLFVYFGNLINSFSNIWTEVISIAIIFIFPLIFSKLANSFKS